MIEAIIFDMFHTLADPHSDLEITEYEPLGVSKEKWAAALWDKDFCDERGLGKISTVDGIFARLGELLGGEIPEEKMKMSRDARIERVRLAITDIRPDILDAVKTLRERGFKMAILSNADVCDRLHWDDSPLRLFFDEVIFSCDVGMAKPSAEIYELASKRLHVKPENTLYIGDGADDELKGAKNAGFTTVRTERLRVWDEERLSGIRPYSDFCVKSLGEIAGIADSL